MPVQPSGYRHEMPDLSYNNVHEGLGPGAVRTQPGHHDRTD
jgi:hypothetical protein